MKKQLIFVLLGAIILFSCKKKKETLPSTQKVYLKNYSAGNSTYNFEYDQANKLTQIVYTEPTVTQHYVIIGYDANNNITGTRIRTSGGSSTKIETYQYDTQNRPTIVERKDSVTNALQLLITYAYIGNKTTRVVSSASGSQISKIEYTYNSNNDLVLEEWFNGSNVKTFGYSFSSYDTKLSPEQLKPHFITNGVVLKRNTTAYVYTNSTTGVLTNYTASLIYSSDDYPTKITYNGGASPYEINYTYEKR